MSSIIALREELAPFVGERVVALLEEALLGAPVNDDLTEAEALLIAWGSSRAAGQQLEPAAAERFERTFTPALRSRLDAFAAALA